MRWIALVVVLSGCSFEVTGVGGGASSANPGDKPPQMTLPPAQVGPPSEPPTTTNTDPVPATPDLAQAPATRSSKIGDSCDDIKDPCAADQVCEHRTSLLGPEIPGGYCSIDCQNTPCPKGSVCSTTFGSTRVCLQACPTSGCRPGYSCCMKQYPSPGVCLPGALCF